MTEKQYLPAGNFSNWLRQMRETLQKESGVYVQCGECTACCTSSYFIHIKAKETGTLAGIPKKLLFDAPGQPKGNVLLGYDRHGRCPMLKNNKCSIYDNRPLTCRIYDCRVFAAAGIDAGDDKEDITKQVIRWNFDYPGKQDIEEQNAVRAAVHFLQENKKLLPEDISPNNHSQLAILAIKVYKVFLKTDRSSGCSTSEIAEKICREYESFENLK